MPLTVSVIVELLADVVGVVARVAGRARRAAPRVNAYRMQARVRSPAARNAVTTPSRCTSFSRMCVLLRAPCSAVTNTGRGDTDRSPALRTETSHRETLVPQGSYTLKLSPPKPMQHHLRWLGSDGARRSKAILVATL